MSSEIAPRSAPRLLKAVEPRPAATSLSPGLLLAFQAFDAAYRLGSFRAAADALHLTPSAVSHRIRNLEHRLGDSLFTRAHRAVRPTASGRALAVTTGRAFSELARAAFHRDTLSSRTRLRLAVVPTFFSTWLIPRLAGFMSSHPEVELIVESVSRGIDFDNEPFDAAISGGVGDWPGMITVELMKIFTTPVCAPDMARRLRLKAPADLWRAPLICVSTYPLAWPLWFERAGMAGSEPPQAVWLDSFGAALQAAERGAGVALGLEPLFEERERAGALCRPIPIRNPTGSYWLVHRPRDQRNPALRALKQWITNAIAQEDVADR